MSLEDADDSRKKQWPDWWGLWPKWGFGPKGLRPGLRPRGPMAQGASAQGGLRPKEGYGPRGLRPKRKKRKEKKNTPFLFIHLNIYRCRQGHNSRTVVLFY